jgi:hypothetical protein
LADVGVSDLLGAPDAQRTLFKTQIVSIAYGQRDLSR